MDYTQGEVHDRLITLQDEDCTAELILPISKVDAIQVNWMIADGAVTLLTATGISVIILRENDMGQKCSDFISDLMKAMRS